MYSHFPRYRLSSRSGLTHLVLAFVRTQEEELHDMSQIMMSKKTRRLYGRMQHGIDKKKEAVEALVRKRKQLEEQEEAKAGKGKGKAKAEPKSAAKKRKSSA